MSYPNITAADVRAAIPHITVTLCTDVRILELVIEATNWAHGKIAGNIDLTALKALTTTPALWQEAIVNRTRSLVLQEKYGTSRTVAAPDIVAWNDAALEIINGLISGETKLLDANNEIIAVGINYQGISSNCDGVDPEFGLGRYGEYVKDKANDKTVY